MVSAHFKRVLSIFAVCRKGCISCAMMGDESQDIPLNEKGPRGGPVVLKPKSLGQPGLDGVGTAFECSGLGKK
jgi:hypothetical protein